MDNKTLGIIIFIVSLVVANIVSVKANNLLDDEKRKELAEMFSKNRKYNLFILLGLVILFFISGYFQLIPVTLNYVLYFLMLLLFMIATNIIIYVGLRKRSFPQEYMKSYILSSCIRFLGIFAFIIMTIQ